MVMPSRRRRPLLPPLPLSFPRPFRFFRSHTHPVRLRMEERERQIRCSAPTGNTSKLERGRSHPVRLRIGKRGRQIWGSGPMGNISKLERGHSPVTPRRTCQTLASSSKVESSSMSDKRFVADTIQGASGGTGQVAQVSDFETTTHRGSSSPPPLDLSNCPDEFKSLAKDRLLTHSDLKNPGALQQYDAYLEWFYYSHRDPAPVASLIDTATMCLEKENSMRSLWGSVNACSNGSTVSKFIVRYMDIVIKEKGEIEHPFGNDAAKCIAKEAELISEWMKCGRRIFTDDEYTLSHDIRVVAAQLFISRWKWSVHIAAALLGIRKEAQWLIENLKRGSDKSISTSMKIRQFALDFVWKKLNELEPYKNEESSESEMASESEDDDAESEDDTYMGDCHDEVYMKFGF